MLMGQKQNGTAEGVLSRRSTGLGAPGPCGAAWWEHRGASGDQSWVSCIQPRLGQLPNVGRSQDKLILPFPDYGGGGAEERELQWLHLY